jgi:hypothetical protein
VIAVVAVTNRRRRLGWQVVRAHQPADHLADDDDPLVAQRGADATIAVALELVADRRMRRRFRPRRPVWPAYRLEHFHIRWTHSHMV